MLDPSAWMMTGDPPRALPGTRSFDWGASRAPRTAWCDTVLYECHVKGMTMTHPEVPPEQRGTYLGLSSRPIVDHLLSLGVTAVELMPVQHRLSEPRLEAMGLSNYWGYNPIGWSAPDERLATAPGRQMDEFRTMVRGLHEAGLEVVLDVVYNHTAEGGADGPALTWKQIDPDVYRRDGQGRFVDWTGCGNTVDFRRPSVRSAVLASLLHWVEVLHVDGFRFDLAPVMGRDCAFLEELAAEPRLQGVKLIAEPWDLGPDGYRLGRFPPGWTQWNDQFRKNARRFWRGDTGQAAQLATRLAGSMDLFRRPSEGVNYVACHDGFTLRDLVSYDHKRNQANGEQGRDGTDHNHSRAWPQPLRTRLQRSLFATVALARGVPMLAHGDELGRTQRGNNNAYCHDSELTWIDWERCDQDQLAFVRRALQVRREQPSLRADEPLEPARTRWSAPDGAELTAKAWRRPSMRTFSLTLDDRLMVLLNASARDEAFTLPDGSWDVLLQSGPVETTPGLRVPPHSIAVLARGGTR